MQGRGAGGADRSRWVSLAGGLLIVAAGAALAIGLEGRDAFWLDESWTGAIIGSPRWSDVAHQIYWDVNAPLYYVLIKLWSVAFGLSDAALRAPSLICAAGVALTAALAPTPGAGRAARLGWAGLIAGWFPTLCYAQEARCYALLLLVCTAQTIAYARLMQAPDTRHAAVWAAFSALAILTHYDALYLGAVQGMLFVARQPRRALACWPAALAFVPAFGWLAIHAPRIAQFARPGIAWYAPLKTAQLPSILDYVIDGGPSGAQMLGAVLVAVALSAGSLRLASRLAARAPEPAEPAGLSPLAWTATASLLAAVLMVAVGFVRPSFTFRYLTPSEPGLMLGVVLVFGVLAGQRLAPMALAGLAVAWFTVSGSMLQHHLRMAPRLYNFEGASVALAAHKPTGLAFLWDHPVDPILHREQLAALGGFFLHRDGMATPVDAVVLRPGEDPNARLVAAARATPQGAILWIYDVVVAGTAATRHPPQITRLAPEFRCRNFARGRFGVLACVRRAEPLGLPAYQRGASQPQGGA